MDVISSRIIKEELEGEKWEGKEQERKGLKRKEEIKEYGKEKV
jgi:hypothetical protein